MTDITWFLIGYLSGLVSLALVVWIAKLYIDKLIDKYFN